MSNINEIMVGVKPKILHPKVSYKPLRIVGIAMVKTYKLLRLKSYKKTSDKK